MFLKHNRKMVMLICTLTTVYSIIYEKPVFTKLLLDYDADPNLKDKKLYSHILCCIVEHLLECSVLTDVLNDKSQ